MSNIAYLAPPRTLVHVLLEVRHLERQLVVTNEQSALVAEGSAEEERLSDHGAALESRLYDLRAEGRRMVEAMTGLAFADLESFQ